MAVLYVDRKTVEVRANGGCIEVWVDSERLQSLPWIVLERLIFSVNGRVDVRVLLECAQRQIPIVFLDRRDWEAFASVTGGESPDCARRMNQMRCYLEAGWREEYCRNLVRAKLLSQLRFLSKLQEERVEARMEARKASDRIRVALEELKPGKENGTARLRGLEGAAARSYFAAYQQVFPKSFGFRGRTRRPPKDPVNVLLSLGYTLVHGLAVGAVRRAGLDASLGFLHEVKHGRQSLACDFTELMRSRLDSLVWDLVRRKEIRKEHFHMEGERCLLGKAGRMHFYAAFEEVRPTMGRWLESGARLLAKAVDRREVLEEAWNEEDVVF